MVDALGEGFDGAVPGLPVADTVKRVGADGVVVETLPRDELVAVQTPQAFVAAVLRARAGERVCLGGDGLRVARRGAGRPGAGRRRRRAAAEGDDAGGPRARRELARGLIVDYHMHLRDPEERVDYSVEGIERFVEVALERGVDEIGFTEHVYYFTATRVLWSLPYQLERCLYDLETYVDAVVEAKRQGLPVKLGLEVDWVGERQDELAAVLDPYPWDYLLGSVHWIDGLGVDQEPGIWADRSVDEVWAVYFAALGQLAASGHVDVLAHPDLAKIFGKRPAAIEYPPLDGVALEISTAGLRKPVGEIYPDQPMLAGRPPITLASDAHVPQDVGRDLDRAVEYARAAGYDTVTVFQGRQGRQEPLG